MKFAMSEDFGNAFGAISNANNNAAADLGLGALDAFSSAYNNKRVLAAQKEADDAARRVGAPGFGVGDAFGLLSSGLGAIGKASGWGATKISDAGAFDAGKAMGTDLAKLF